MIDLAAAPFRTIVPQELIPNGSVVPCYLDSSKRRIAIARVDGRIYAFDDLCACGGGPCPLSGGLLKGTTIMCQCHGSRFDIATGAVINGPATRALNLVVVEEVDGNIRVRA